MKRFISALTALCIVTGSFAVYADNFTAVYAEEIASGVCGENLTWTLDSDGTLTISGTGTMTEYKLAEGEYPEWYEYRDKIDRIIINGAENITDFAFSSFTALTAVHISDSVKSIGKMAFMGCENISDIIISKNVEKIGSGAFMGCTKLKNVTFRHGEDENGEYIYNPQEIGQSAFSSCSYLENIVLPPSVSRIEKNTFANSGLKEIILNENINYIGEKAFNMCSDLEKIIIENPDCEIFNADDTICSMGVIADEAINVFEGTICGHTGSTAQAYAEKYAVSLTSLGMDKCKFRSLDYKYTAGDANMDGSATISDSVAILQYLANAEKYPLSEDAKVNADVFGTGDGITGNDALSIQKLDAGSISKLPESFDDTYIIWNSGDVFQWYSGTEIDYDGNKVDNSTIKISAFPEKTFTWNEPFLPFYTDGTDTKYISYAVVSEIFFADLNDDSYPEVCLNESGTGMVHGIIAVHDLHNDKVYRTGGGSASGYYRFEKDKDGQFTVCNYSESGNSKYAVPKIINDELVLE